MQVLMPIPQMVKCDTVCKILNTVLGHPIYRKCLTKEGHHYYCYFNELNYNNWRNLCGMRWLNKRMRKRSCIGAQCTAEPCVSWVDSIIIRFMLKIRITEEIRLHASLFTRKSYPFFKNSHHHTSSWYPSWLAISSFSAFSDTFLSFIWVSRNGHALCLFAPSC